MKRLALIILALGVLLLPAAAFASELPVLNGGFELQSGGLPADWYFESWFSNGTSSAATVWDEQRGACAHIANIGEDDARLCQSIAVKPNSYYKISCYIKTNGVLGGAGANVSVLNTLATSEAITGTGDWQLVELVGKTARGQRSLTVCIRLGGYGALSSGEAWFDDVSVQKLAYRPAVYADFSQYEAEPPAVNEQGAVPYMGLMVAMVFITLLAFMLCQRFFICQGVREPRRIGSRGAMAAVLVLAFFVRLATALEVYGHPTDINCFMAWANALAESGPSNFYTSGMFADYTPGYMYVLWLLGTIARLLGLEYGGTGYMLLIKMPSIVGDLLAAYLVYKIAKKRFGQRPVLASILVAFNPVMLFVSAGWGQIDQILALLLLAVICLFEQRRIAWAGIAYGLAVLVKPQALMVGPLLAVTYIVLIINSGAGWKRALGKTAIAVFGAIALIFTASLPFKSTQGPLWLLERYFSTATSYPYASVEAFNLMALLGGNWKSVESALLGLNYGAWGSILIALCLVFSGVMYAFGSRRSRHALVLCAAYLLCGLFVVGQYMHERYLFPALLLLLVAAIYYADRRLYLAFGWLSTASLLNVLCAFVIVSNQSARGAAYNTLTIIGSMLHIGAFGYLTYVCCQLVFKGKISPAFGGEAEGAGAGQEVAGTEVMPAPGPCRQLPPPTQKGPRFEKKDHAFCWALTAVYAVVALLNLGTAQAPQTYWLAEVGDTARLEFAEPVQLSDIRVFGGLYTGTATFSADDGTVITYEQQNGGMFRWEHLGGDGVFTKGLDIAVTGGQIWLNEVACFDAEGSYIAAESAVAELCDEPAEVPAVPSYLNGMYFDELYHARTAYEHLNGLSPYENSHPPLGKVFIMLGIAVFGMNALGWRIVGTLFGIGMVPVIYLFAKRLFKRAEYALLAGVLFAFDFMHFTQTRIATIDVYGVFFILLMFYFMYEYFRMNFYVDGLKATLKPLALSGVFFGLGAASKWISFYAGLGLAVVFFTSLAMRWIEYFRFRGNDERVSACLKNTVLTLLWCCLFFIAVPVVIYVASYIPYFVCETPYDLKGVWGVQEFMFTYHSGLTATHPYSSSWWQWPLSLRPVWYHAGYDVAEGNISTISAFGNLAVWLPCAVGTAILLVRLLKGRVQGSKGAFVALVGVGSNFMPWMFITRCTFLYHYFATVPFIILCALFVLLAAESKRPQLAWAKWAWMGLTVAMFLLFYPVISGLECPRAYVAMLEWLPNWTFMGV